MQYLQTTYVRFLLFSSIAILLFTSTSNAQSPQRTWTSANGKFKIEATLESADTNQVTLKKANGSVIKIEPAKLSNADRQYLNELSKEAEKKVEAVGLNVRGVLRIGIPEPGFAWGEINETPNYGGTLVNSSCKKEGTSDIIQLLLMAKKCVDQNEQTKFANEFIKGVIEGLEEEGWSTPEVKGPASDGNKRKQYMCSILAKNQSGVTKHTIVKMKFGETSIVIFAQSESLERASKLCELIDTAKELKGKESKTALESFRRFHATALGISLNLPLDLELASQRRLFHSFSITWRSLYFRSVDAHQRRV